MTFLCVKTSKRKKGIISVCKLFNTSLKRLHAWWGVDYYLHKSEFEVEPAAPYPMERGEYHTWLQSYEEKIKPRIRFSWSIVFIIIDSLNLHEAKYVFGNSELAFDFLYF